MQVNQRFNIPLLFKLTFGLILGVICAFYAGVYAGFWLLLVSVGLLCLLSVPAVRMVKGLNAGFGIMSFILFFLLGTYLVRLNTGTLHPNYFAGMVTDQEALLQVLVVDQPEEKKNSVKLIGEVQLVNGEKSTGKGLFYLQKEEGAKKIKYGDVLVLRTRINAVQRNGNPKEFDYARYLKLHNIAHQAYVKTGNWIYVGNQGGWFWKQIFSFRGFLENKLETTAMKPENLMVAKALVLGQKEALDRDTLRSYSSAGAMHVLAVSGLHVGIIMLVVSFLLVPIKRLRNGKLLFTVLVLAAVWGYALITGMSSSVLRASVMFSFVVVGREMERDTSVYQSIVASAFLLIVVEPLVIFQVGFQLSYLAVLGIVFLQPKLYNLIYVAAYLPDKVWQITSVSIAAQVATFPLGLYYFHQFPNFFLLSNLIVIPLAFAILVAGICYFLMGWVPYLERLIFVLFDGLITVLNAGVKWVESLPFSIYWGVSIHWFEVFGLYLVLLMMIVAFTKRNGKLLIAGLSVICLLLGFNIVEQYTLRRTNQLVIYNVSNAVAIDVFTGQKNYFIASESLLRDEDKLLFHVKHNWFYRSGKEKPEKAIVYDGALPVIQYGDTHLLLLNQKSADAMFRQKIPQVETVYLLNIATVAAEIIADWQLQGTKVVLGDNVGWQLKRRLNEVLSADQMHNLKLEGAYQVSF